MPIKNISTKINKLPRFKPSKTFIVRFLVLLVLAASIGSAGYFYYLYKNESTTNAAKDVERTVAAVNKLMMLPSEIPTLATVTDKSKLTQQPFFQLAENGDKVLIYQSIKKAILYRPSVNKIVDVAPVQIDKNQDVQQAQEDQNAVLGTQITPTGSLSGTPSPTPESENVVIALYNGTSTRGATGSVQEKLANNENVTFLDPQNAQKVDYENSMVIVLKSSAGRQAREISEQLGYELSEKVPEGETSPEGADILIIVGQES